MDPMDQRWDAVFAEKIRKDATIDGLFLDHKQLDPVPTKPRTGFRKTNVFETNINPEGRVGHPRRKRIQPIEFRYWSWSDPDSGFHYLLPKPLFHVQN
jgi:hypothetical protein